MILVPQVRIIIRIISIICIIVITYVVIIMSMMIIIILIIIVIHTPRYGFVEFKNEEDADYTIKILNMIRRYC